MVRGSFAVERHLGCTDISTSEITILLNRLLKTDPLNIISENIYCIGIGGTEIKLHTITMNEELRFIEVKLEGMCSMEEFQSFTAELRTSIARFPAGPKPPATLYDFTGATIQTQEVVLAMKALAEHPAMTHRRVAMYTEGVLARQQAKRICENRSNMFVFPSRAEAIAWLVS